MTELWEMERLERKLIAPTLPNDYSYGSGFLVDIGYCRKATTQERQQKGSRLAPIPESLQEGSRKAPTDFYFWTWMGSESKTLVVGSSINVGETVKISEACNPDFVDGSGDACKKYHENGWCIENPEFLVSYGIYDSTEQTYQTGLNCPECGCTDTSIIKLPEFPVGNDTSRSAKKDERK